MKLALPMATMLCHVTVAAHGPDPTAPELLRQVVDRLPNNMGRRRDARLLVEAAHQYLVFGQRLGGLRGSVGELPDAEQQHQQTDGDEGRA